MRQDASDIPQGSWVNSVLPGGLQPYARLARLDRPIGTWLLLLPCWWGLALANADHPALALPSPWYILLFAIGALVMRGAGCTWNDITDRDFDGKVARTATRPIPAGEVTVRQALVFLAVQLLIGLAILWQFNDFTRMVGASALLLVMAYPFMKRVTYWPQAWLGLTFNWGALVGWTSMKQELSLAPLLLYAAGFFWTLGYDTIYAHQDKEDDALVGVKSTALRLGAATGRWLIGFYSLTIILIAASAYLAGLAVWFWPLLAVAAIHLAWQIRRLDIDDPDLCLRLFKSNRDFGFIIFAGLLAGGI
ncbi:4-hydroxybenzoate octaprenyltransferase [Aestuariispira insulae]|uniref:4-hydroxybenzoate octaprenyltransferase n=1 Tax=Aestuariispira insulae TaxID=1461337 RepID=A0A3D9HAE5_9PROT|nr:4-hydroxybenzoate octaprenyltransferase [Aestuariispira insulae]RED46151.1 4-hydroxybenzoate polyprenyltransferase [Aestuariispira insulae]